MPLAALLLLFATLLQSGCSREDVSQTAAEDAAPWVRTVALRKDSHATFQVSGRVHARFETPLAFQVDGRIIKRHVDAGQQVSAGQVLFELDPQDLREALHAAEAAHEAATAEQRTAAAELVRQRDLLKKKFVGQQSYERAELLEQAARAQAKAAQANLERARHALGYAVLRAERAGTLIDVLGEAGQVVDTGQTLAILAADGEREVEVALPDGTQPPTQGRAVGNGAESAVVLREVAGAADPTSLTWRARYRLLEGAAFPLGSVVRVMFSSAGSDSVFEVPIGALDERAAGPRIWRVVDGKAQPQPVVVLAGGGETARIRAELPDDARVIAVGTHLLTPGMQVREQRR